MKLKLILFIIFTQITTVKSQVMDWVIVNQTNSAYANSFVRHVNEGGFIYNTGYSVGTIDLDPGPGVFNLSSSNGPVYFIQKLDPNGNFVWARKYIPSIIIADSDKNFICVGELQGTQDLNYGTGIDTLTSNGGRDVFILKMDSNMNFIWAKSFGGSLNVDVSGVELDQNDNIHITGQFRGTVDFNPGFASLNLTAGGGSHGNIFVLKLDQNGNLNWVRTFYSNSGSTTNAIAVDSLGNVYTGGSLYGTVDFDPGPGVVSRTSSAYDDAFLHKLDHNGNFVWVRKFGSNSVDVIRDLAVDKNGFIITTGTFNNTVDMDPGSGIINRTSNGFNDAFVNKFDNNGNLVWVKTFGGVSADIPTSLAVDDFGNIYTTGYFGDTVDFDPGPNNSYQYGISFFYNCYLQVLDPNGNYIQSYIVNTGPSAQSGRSNYNNVLIDHNNNIYTTGVFSGVGHFGVGGVNQSIALSGNEIGFLQKVSGLSTALKEIDYSKQVSIFPNPTKNDVSISFNGNSEIKSYVLRNSMGQEIKSGQILSNDNFALQLPEESGLYFIEILEGDTRTIKKVIKY